MTKKIHKCDWEFIDKWSDCKRTFYEFYCRRCLGIRLKIIDEKEVKYDRPETG